MTFTGENKLTITHIEAKFAWDNGATEEEMKEVLMMIRHSQWRWDYACASINSAFHAPIEALRILSTGIEKAGQARVLISKVLSKHGYNEEVPIPDISTKELAQKYIGLDMEKIRENKKKFKQEILPTWSN